MAELDPRWSWVEIVDMASDAPTYIKGRCNHLELHPVTLSLTGEEVGVLCATCDTVLPPGTRSGESPEDDRLEAITAARFAQIRDSIAGGYLLPAPLDPGVAGPL